MFDFFKDRSDEFMTGYYWVKYPSPTVHQEEEGRISFNYSKAAARQKTYNTELQNLRLDTERYSIKTCDDCGFKIGGYVSTQNGAFWIIEDIVADEQTTETEEALLMWKESEKTERVIRLRRYQNPWEIAK
jgi:hypothetical protein